MSERASGRVRVGDWEERPRRSSGWAHKAAPFPNGCRLYLHVAVVHERRVDARLAALHVVRVERALAPELKERDDRDNLPLGRERDRVPLGLRGAARERRHVTLEGLRPRELDAVGAREVADERGHGDAAVLDLGVAEPANGGLVGRAKGPPRLGRPDWVRSEERRSAGGDERRRVAERAGRRAEQRVARRGGAGEGRHARVWISDAALFVAAARFPGMVEG